MTGDWQQIEVLAMDIDGTLTTSGMFSTSVLASLYRLREAGLKLILVTGRPSGWVQGLVSYLPVDAAIAENGGVIFQGAESLPWLRDASADDYAPIKDSNLRAKLETVFSALKRNHPELETTEDNCYRLSDFTFHAAGLTSEKLFALKAEVEKQECAFTWSTIHAHIMPHGQQKGAALRWLLKRMNFPSNPAVSTLTVGDSPNDATLFAPAFFPVSVGVANIEKYRHMMDFFPAEVSSKSEGDGFVEIADRLLAVKGRSF